MFEKQMQAKQELKQAFQDHVLTRMVTENNYKIEENISNLYIIFNSFSIDIHFNDELTKYFTINEIENGTKNHVPFSNFSLDKFFTADLTVQILLNLITKLEKTYALVSLHD
jgi:hypothetical protein